MELTRIEAYEANKIAQVYSVARDSHCHRLDVDILKASTKRIE